MTIKSPSAPVLRLPFWLSDKESTCSAGDMGSIPGSESSPTEEMATHCSILAWETPWTEEPAGLQSTGSHRVRHDWDRGMMKMRSKGCGDCLVSGESVIVEVVVNCSFLEFTLLQWWWLPWPFLPLGHKVRFTLTLPKRPNLHRHEETSLAGT